MKFFVRYFVSYFFLAVGISACSKGADSYTMKVSVSKLAGQSNSGPAKLTFRPDPDVTNSSLNGGILVG